MKRQLKITFNKKFILSLAMILQDERKTVGVNYVFDLIIEYPIGCSTKKLCSLKFNYFYKYFYFLFYIALLQRTKTKIK